MFRRLSWICVLLLAELFFNLFSGAAQAPDGGETAAAASFAALLPVSGGSAEQGDWIVKGLQLGLEKAERLYDRKFALVVEDTAGDPKAALSAYQSLQARSDFPVVFTYGSGVGVALTPVVNRDKVIQFGLATATPAYRTAEDYTFRNFPSAELEAHFLVRSILETLRASEIGILKINNEYGMGSAKAFREEFEKLGGKILFEETLEPGNHDFKSTLLRLRRTPAKFIYLAAYPAEGALVLKQMRQLGMTAQVVASVAIIGSKQFLELAGEGSENLLVATSTPVYLENSDPTVREFVELYKQKYREEPGVQHIYAARAYDAMLLTAAAVAHCSGAKPECIRDYLFTVKGYPGASGVLTFDRSGDVENTFSLQRIERGVFTAYRASDDADRRN